MVKIRIRNTDHETELFANPAVKDLVNLPSNLNYFTFCNDVSSCGKIGKELSDKGLAQIGGRERRPSRQPYKSGLRAALKVSF